MVEALVCPNPRCGHPSRQARDALGRTFRCGRCGAKLGEAATRPRGESKPKRERKRDCLAGSKGRRPLGVALPSRVGRFEVRGALGSGTFATVYRAFDPDLEREVALKVPHRGVSDSSKAMARLEAEAKALARLRHAGIVPLFEVGGAGETPYLATAFIPGPTLERLIQPGPLDPRHAAGVAAELAGALTHAHGRGVAHRDVKPANVVADENGAVFLTDFGLAWRADPNGRPPVNGMMVGTPAYLAPEQPNASGLDALALCDQYSLGVVLYEMLCGRPPFEGTPSQVLCQSRFQEPTPPRSLRPDVPPRLDLICRKAMSRRAEDRYPDCASLAAELRDWLDSTGPVAEHAHENPLAGSIGQALGWLRGHRRTVAAAALAVATIVSGWLIELRLPAERGSSPKDYADSR